MLKTFIRRVISVGNQSKSNMAGTSGAHAQYTADSESEGQHLPGSSDNESPSWDDTRSTNRGRARRGRGRGRQRGTTGRSDRSGADGWVWVREPEVYTAWIKPFDESVGYTGTKALTDVSPMDILSLFLTDEFWNFITDETNRYAGQVIASMDMKPRSRFLEWYDVSVSEMKAFLALHFAMGLVEKAEIEDYWATFWLTRTPGFGTVMSRNRFEIILSFFHFANNNDYVRRGEPGHDKLFKVRPIIEMIIPKFAAVYSPLKELSLDEMTIAFKGRSTLKMYSPNKPDKYGYRVYALSESSSGYVLGWSLHTGQYKDITSDISATHAVVRELAAPYTGKGHEVYMDSYYTSPTIANELADLETGLCGTVRSTRHGMPNCLRKNALHLRRGDEPVFLRKGKMLACAWHDTKRVTMLSTFHGNGCVQKRIRTKENATGFRIINRPLCVDQYNKCMGGVDTSDQRMKTYLFPHRSRKWYHRIFNAVLSISVVNSHIIYTKCTPGPHKALKAYIQDIIDALLAEHTKKESTKGGRPSRAGGVMPQRLTERHWLCETEERPDCVVCSDRSRTKGRRQTKYRCRQCGVGLCPVPCNERYHTLKNYKCCHLDR